MLGTEKIVAFDEGNEMVVLDTLDDPIATKRVSGTMFNMEFEVVSMNVMEDPVGIVTLVAVDWRDMVVFAFVGSPNVTVELDVSICRTLLVETVFLNAIALDKETMSLEDGTVIDVLTVTPDAKVGVSLKTELL